jgi:hypothetical protein
MYTPLPSRVQQLSPWSQPQRSRTRALSALIAFAVVSVIGYFAFQDMTADKSPAAPPTASVTVSAKPAGQHQTPSEQEDFLRHLEEARGNVLKAGGDVKRSEDWIHRALPGLARNYLTPEERRLQAALAALAAARERLEQTRYEIELIKNLQQERKHE